MPVYTGDYEQTYRDVKGHSRTCLNCGRLIREESDRPSDRWFADSYRSEIGHGYRGVRSRDRRHTEKHADAVFCEECGTTDSRTQVGTQETLPTGDVLDRLEGVLDGVEELHDVPVDREQAICVAKSIKQDPDRTSTRANDVLALAVGFGIERATYLAERGSR